METGFLRRIFFAPGYAPRSALPGLRPQAAIRRADPVDNLTGSVQRKRFTFEETGVGACKIRLMKNDLRDYIWLW